MNKLLIGAMLLLCMDVACGQSVTVATGNDKAAVGVSADEQKAADAFCLRETGTHLRAITAKPRHQRAVECAGAPGRSYSREDIQRSGAMNTADALRLLDPSIR